MLDEKLKKTLILMFKGTAIYNLVVLVLSIIVGIIYCNMKNIVNSEAFVLIAKNSICVVLGFIWSMISMYIMAVSIDKAVSSQNEKYAKSHVAIVSTIKMLVFCIILVILINEKAFGFSGGILFAVAVFGTKIGTYLVPLLGSKK